MKGRIKLYKYMHLPVNHHKKKLWTSTPNSKQYFWNSLEAANVESEYLTLIQNIFANKVSQIKLDRLGREFQIKKEIKQGDPLSTDLFNSAIRKIMQTLNWEEKEELGISIYGKNLRFADNIVVIAKSSP